MAGPLAGYRIVDLTTMLTGPWATFMLGDQGADVIKVEMPGAGDHTRSLGNRRGGLSASFLNLNRSKRSLGLDLKHPEGRSVLLKLAASADVFIQNFRPGVVERLGVSEPEVRAVAPEVVYVSISGFGERGPLADRPTYDPIVQALSGLTTIQAGSDHARPRLIRTVLPDKLTALAASQAICAALLARERTGKGQHVRLSMLDTVLSFMWASDMGGLTFVDQPLTHQEAASFIDLIYETRDGYITVSTMSDKQWAGFCRAFARPDLHEDPRFATPQLRDRNVNERLALIQEELKARTTQESLTLLEREDVPCAPRAHAPPSYPAPPDPRERDSGRARTSRRGPGSADADAGALRGHASRHPARRPGAWRAQRRDSGRARLLGTGDHRLARERGLRPATRRLR